MGPYEYLIFRSEGISGTLYQQIKSILTTDLNDTVFVDTLLNTQSKGYIIQN